MSRAEIVNGNDINKISKKYIGYNLDDVKNASMLYRGIKNENDKDILFIQPSKYIRNKTAGGDYFTRKIVDNSEHWKEYPKRSRSIIGSTNKNIANNYAFETNHVYSVYPKLNAKIAVCPKSDYINSFSEGMRILSYFFSEIVTYQDDIYSLEGHFIRVFPKLIKDNSIEKIKHIINSYKKMNKEKRNILKKCNCLTVYDLIDYCLSPELNRFELITYNKKFKINGSKEIWTDSDSLMIKAK
jgi:hypothetical protein